MALPKVLQDAFGKLRKLLRESRLKKLLRASLRGGLQAASRAWRERRRKPLPNDFTHTFYARDYPGSRTRRYLVHAPRGKTGGRPRPLVLVLHGCRQDNRDIEKISGFNDLADRHGFLVAYPFITSYRGLRNKNCWGWWFQREIHAGAGEVEDLWRIVEEIGERYPVDPRRIHVTGLSSGAGMAVAMMVAHADKIASGAVVAELPYAEKPDAVVHAFNHSPRNRPVVVLATEMRRELGADSRTVPIQIVHSKNDDKVYLQSAEALRDSWGHCFEIDTREAQRVHNGQVNGTSWEHSLYRNGSGKSVIETLFLEGPGHGWYGGNPGNFSYPDAPDIKRYMWKFFASHPLN